MSKGAFDMTTTDQSLFPLDGSAAADGDLNPALLLRLLLDPLPHSHFQGSDQRNILCRVLPTIIMVYIV